MANDPLTKIHQLITLASSDNENEARNAAYLACRLIRQHGVTLSLPKASSKDRKAPRRQPEKPTVVATGFTTSWVDVNGHLHDFDFEGFIDPKGPKRGTKKRT